MSNNIELVQNTKAIELTAKIRMLKQMLRLFEHRHANLFQNKIHCCSWEQNYLEGAYDDCGVFVKYIETRIKKLEKQQNKKKGG